MKFTNQLLAKSLAVFLTLVVLLTPLLWYLGWALPNQRSRDALRQASQAFGEQGLPTRRHELFDPGQADHVTPILRKLYEIHRMPLQLESLQPIHRKRHSPQHAVHRICRNHMSDSRAYAHQYSEEDKQVLREYVSVPEIREALDLIGEATKHSHRNGSRDYVFHGPNLPRDQYRGTRFLQCLLAHEHELAKTDPSRSPVLFDALLLELKMSNLLVQGYTLSHYSDRLTRYRNVFAVWMHLDRVYGTDPAARASLGELIDEVGETELWLKCHDGTRLGGLSPSYLSIEHDRLWSDYESRGKPMAEFFSFRVPHLRRQMRKQSEEDQEYALYLNGMMKTRGVSARHHEAAIAMDALFAENFEQGHLFLPPYMASWIKDYHQLMAWHELMKVGLAVNAYADDHQQLPDRLERLVPEYLDEVPCDRFPIGEGNPLIYEVWGEVFVLKSVEGDIDFRGRRTVDP